MRQALVTKLESESILVMTDIMTIERLKKRDNIKVGQPIEFSKKDIYHGIKSYSLKKMVALISIFLIIAISFVMITIQGEDSEVSATISVDINPSIEIDLDKKGEISEIRGLNSDALLLDIYSMEGHRVEDVLQLIINESQLKGFLMSDGNILIALKVNNHEENTINEDINRFISNNKEKFRFTCIEVNRDEDLIETEETQDLSIGRRFLAKFSQSEVDEMSIKSVSDLLEEAHLTSLVNEAESITINTMSLAKIQKEFVQIQQAASEQTMITEEVSNYGEFEKQTSVRKSERDEAKNEIKEIKEEYRMEKATIKDDFDDEIKDEMKDELKDELKESIDAAKDSAKEDLKDTKELKEEFKDKADEDKTDNGSISEEDIKEKETTNESDKDDSDDETIEETSPITESENKETFEDAEDADDAEDAEDSDDSDDKEDSDDKDDKDDSNDSDDSEDVKDKEDKD